METKLVSFTLRLRNIFRAVLEARFWCCSFFSGEKVGNPEISHQSYSSCTRNNSLIKNISEHRSRKSILPNSLSIFHYSLWLMTLLYFSILVLQLYDHLGKLYLMVKKRQDSNVLNEILCFDVYIIS